MAFTALCNNLQKVKTTFKLTRLDGTDEPILGLAATVIAGDGSVSNVGNGGESLPLSQIYLVSGTASSDLGADTLFQVDIARVGGTVRAIVTLRVTTAPPPEVIVDITFSTPELK